RPWLNNDVLDDEVLISLEACTDLNVFGLDDLGLIDGDLGALGATSSGALALSFGASLRRLLHAARLQLRPAFQPLEPRVLLAQCCYLCISLGNLLVGLHSYR